MAAAAAAATSRRGGGGRAMDDENLIFETTAGVEVVGSFDQMGIRDGLLRGIYAYGFEKPSAIQQRAVLPIVSGGDVIAQAQSGTGKTSMVEGKKRLIKRVLLHGSPLGFCLRYSRKHHLLPGVPCTNPYVCQGVPEEVDGGLQLRAVHRRAVQLDAVDLLRAREDERQPAPHHQHGRLRHRVGVHRHVPRLRPQECQAEDGCLLPAAERGGLHAHRRRHGGAGQGAPPGEGSRQHLPRLLHGRLCRAFECDIHGDPDEERRVHAVLAVALPHAERRRVVLLRPVHQGPLRHASQRRRLLLRLHPDGPLPLVPEAEGRHPADDDRRCSPGNAGAGDRAARPQGHHPVNEPHLSPERGEDRTGGARRQGDRRRGVTMSRRFHLM